MGEHTIMGFLDQIRILRLRLRRTWAAWNAPMPRLYRADRLNDGKKAELRHILAENVEGSATDLKDALLEDWKKEVQDQTAALDEAHRSGNGNGDD